MESGHEEALAAAEQRKVFVAGLSKSPAELKRSDFSKELGKDGGTEPGFKAVTKEATYLIKLLQGYYKSNIIRSVISGPIYRYFLGDRAPEIGWYQDETRRGLTSKYLDGFRDLDTVYKYVKASKKKQRAEYVPPKHKPADLEEIIAFEMVIGNNDWSPQDIGIITGGKSACIDHAYAFSMIFKSDTKETAQKFVERLEQNFKAKFTDGELYKDWALDYTKLAKSFEFLAKMINQEEIAKIVGSRVEFLKGKIPEAELAEINFDMFKGVKPNGDSDREKQSFETWAEVQADILTKLKTMQEILPEVVRLCQAKAKEQLLQKHVNPDAGRQR